MNILLKFHYWAVFKYHNKFIRRLDWIAMDILEIKKHYNRKSWYMMRKWMLHVIKHHVC